MDRNLRYWGEFHSKNGTLWRTEIWQKPGEGEIWEVSRMTFPQEKPLEIEWSSVDKIEPLQPSNATLAVVSDTDRQYLTMYTLEAGSILLKVFRDCQESAGSEEPASSKYLYWSGTLDPELYEEPFSEAQDYEVTLTFSDLAILDRLNFERKEAILNIGSLIRYCLEATGTDIALDGAKAGDFANVVKCISTKRDEQDILVIDHLMCNNFVDEKGVPSTLKEVLEGILQPYALRLVQKGGKFVLYDLNGVYRKYAKEPVPVEWAGTDATIAMDKVYSNVKLKFSPYGVNKLMEPKVKIQFEKSDKIGFKADYSSGSPLSFYMYHSDKGSGLKIPSDGKAKFFYIEPIEGGEECSGVLWSLLDGELPISDYPKNSKPFNRIPDSDNYTYARLDVRQDITEMPLAFSVESDFLPRSGFEVMRDAYLNIQLPLLLDTRYNPFNAATDNNDKDSYDYMQSYFNYVYACADLEVIDDKEKTSYYYDNKQRVESNSSDVWRGGAPEKRGNLRLAYYKKDGDHLNTTGVGGWADNRQARSATYKPLPSYELGVKYKGEYISLPPVMGKLRLSVYGVLKVVDTWDSGSEPINAALKHRWWAYKPPVMELHSARYHKKQEAFDLEISAFINKLAKNDVELKTIVGSMRERDSSERSGFLYTSRGVFRNAQGIPYASKHKRDGMNQKTDFIEHLLINTVYSQYGKRHLKLSGTVELLPEFGIYTDRTEKGPYIVLSEVQDLMEDESKISMVQLSEEVYEGIKYEEKMD